MKFIDLQNGILAARIEGEVSESDLKQCKQKASELETEHSGVDIYLEIKDFKGYEVRGFFKDLKSAFANHSTFDNVAVVCREPWLERYAEVLQALGSRDIQTFGEGEEPEAREWIISKAKGK